MTRNREGFALPMAVLLIGFMTAGVMAAFARSQAEVRTVDDNAVELEALAVAQDGLARAIISNKTTPADTIFNLPLGTARIRRTLLKAAATTKDTSVWLFRSTGRTTARPRRPSGQRDIAQIVYRAPGDMQVLSSWTSLSGLVKDGSAGTLDGNDNCGLQPTLPGTAVPAGGYTQNGSGTVVYGDPPVEYMGSQNHMNTQIKIDWPSIANPFGPAVQPDYIICVPASYGYDPNWGPCTGYPSKQSWNDPNFWPVILFNGYATLPTSNKSGRGTLIVTGDLEFGGGEVWDGIVLVGGVLKDNGGGSIQGAVVTGLNIKKGMPVNAPSDANGSKGYEYDSCAVEKAAGKFARNTPVLNAWMDNWPAW